MEHNVKVFNTFYGRLAPGDSIVSPGFNGCHGVLVWADNNAAFVHQPPFFCDRIEKQFPKMAQMFADSKRSEVVFVAPRNEAGEIESQFVEYERLLKETLANPSFKYFAYPRRNPGGHAWTFRAAIAEGGLRCGLSKVSDEFVLAMAGGFEK
jgi:hypothetical protein